MFRPLLALAFVVEVIGLIAAATTAWMRFGIGMARHRALTQGTSIVTSAAGRESSGGALDT
jgi:hypothetical protein